MDLFFVTITWFGSLMVLVPTGSLLVLVLIRSQRGVDALLIGLGLLGASALTHLLKLIFARPRPAVQELLIGMPSDFSFPSAHTSQAFAFACACALVFARSGPFREAAPIWIALFTTALLVGISRIYLKVHYSSDVVAGAIIGTAWVLILFLLVKSSLLKG